ncbi:Usherin [Taenia solium]|eukprot:TsM_000906800 transcript=TsM_000906800 gene=TsM_000906800
MTCFWKPPPDTPPAKYRVWINNSAETYLLGEQDSSQLFAFIPSKDLQSDTPYSCLVEACSELGECSPRAQSPIVRSDKRQLPVPINVRLVYESGGFLRCYWEHPVKVDIPLVHYRTFLYVDGRKKEIRPPTSARKTAIDFINESVKPNREYACEIMACFLENRGRLVCSGSSSKSTIITPVRPPSKPLNVKLTTPEPRTIQVAWQEPARTEMPDHLLYEFVFKWIPQETEFLITFDPRKEKGGLVYRHKTDEDYQQVEVSITACSERFEGVGGGCSEAVKVKGITWPGRPKPIEKPIAKVRNPHELIVTWEVPKNPPGVMVNYTAMINDDRHNVSIPCSVKHRDLVSTLSCAIENIPDLNEYKLSVIGCIAPNSDGNGGGCSPPSVRTYHKDMQGRPSPPSNVTVVEIGAGQLEVKFQVDEKLQESTVYFLVEAEVENRTVALCRTSLTHSCTLEGLNSSVNYAVIVRSCNTVNDSMKSLCGPPSDPSNLKLTQGILVTYFNKAVPRLRH